MLMLELAKSQLFLLFFISQNKSLVVPNTNLFCSYNIISSLLRKFGLIMEYGKMEVFHFSRSYGVFNPPSLDLTSLGVSFFIPKIYSIILGSYLIRNYCFNNILISIQIRLFQPSNAWRYWGIFQEVSFLFKRDVYINVVLYQ